MADLSERLEKLFLDEAFLKKLENVESEAALLALLQGEGMTEQEAKQALEEIVKLGISEGELDENALENVAGGGAIWNAIKAAVKKALDHFRQTSKPYLFKGIR